MFEVKWTAGARATYDQLRAKALACREPQGKAKRVKASKDEGLFKQIVKTVTLLSANPRHPGLKTHEYNSIENPFDKTQKVFEANAQNNTPGAYRVFWSYGPGKQELTIIAITPHP